jgi:RNase P protein component
LNQVRLAQPLDLVLVARPPINGKSFAEVETDFLAAMQRARLLKQTA